MGANKIRLHTAVHQEHQLPITIKNEGIPKKKSSAQFGGYAHSAKDKLRGFVENRKQSPDFVSHRNVYSTGCCFNMKQLGVWRLPANLSNKPE
jgi:hypothetical protein